MRVSSGLYERQGDKERNDTDRYDNDSQAARNKQWLQESERWIEHRTKQCSNACAKDERDVISKGQVRISLQHCRCLEAREGKS